MTHHVSSFHNELERIGIMPAQLYGAPPIDHRRELMAVGLSLGDRTVARPLDLNTPILFSGLPGNLMRPDHRRALITGAGAAGTVVSCGWLGILEDERTLAERTKARLMAELTPARYGASIDIIGRADAVTLSLVNAGSGSIDGLGSAVLVPAELATELKEGLGLANSGPVASPVRLLDMDTPRDLAKLIQLIREITTHEVPVLVKLSPGRVYNDIRIAVAGKPDGVIVDCTFDQVGHEETDSTGDAALPMAAGQLGMPGLGVLAQLELGLKESKADQADVKLLIQADLRSGADIFKVLAFGASGVIVNTAALTPAGLVTDGTTVPTAKIDVDRAGAAIGMALDNMLDELKMVTAWAGHDGLAKIAPGDLRALDYHTAAITGLKLVGYEKTLAMWEH